jgi:hypothetical protein
VSSRAGSVGGSRSLTRRSLVKRHNGVYCRIYSIDSVEMRLYDLHRRAGALTDVPGEFGSGVGVQVGSTIQRGHEATKRGKLPRSFFVSRFAPKRQ